jgi:hypothetical protein
MLKKKNLGKFSKNYLCFYQKKVHYALKYMGLESGIRDPRSGIRKKPIPDPGVSGQKGTGSRIPDPDPQHWSLTAICFNIFYFHLEFLVLVKILSRLIQNPSNHLILRKMVCLGSGRPLFIQTTASKNCVNRKFYVWRAV